MGYDISSPIKQVWLPLDYTFISENAGDARTFIKKYKEKFGIDLHDLFELVSLLPDYYSIRLKEKLIGAYCDNENNYQNLYIGNLARTNAIKEYSNMQYIEDSETIATLLSIEIKSGDDNWGYGFRFCCPENKRPNTIDDLNIELVEI